MYYTVLESFMELNDKAKSRAVSPASESKLKMSKFST